MRLLQELMDDPARYDRALESFVARVTCRLAWGRSEACDELKQRARELLVAVSPAGSLGNRLPCVMRLPECVSPARAWEARRARTERAWFERMRDEVARDVAAPPSWMGAFLRAPAAHGFAGPLEGAYAVGMHGIAGALTVAAPMQAFCLAMCHHPRYLPLLHEELDRVCPGRLPTNADRADLPFLRAVIREVIRWRPPVPTGIPHYLSEDDEYEGYFLPKGAIVHPLEWAICRDPGRVSGSGDVQPAALAGAAVPDVQGAADAVSHHHQHDAVWVREEDVSGSDCYGGGPHCWDWIDCLAL